MILGSQQDWDEATEVSCIPPSLHAHSLLNNQLPASHSRISHNWGTHMGSSPPNSLLTYLLFLTIVHSIVLNKCIVPYSHQNSKQDNFITPNILCILSIYLCLPASLHNHWLVHCLYVLAFPECHIVGIVQYVTFWFGFIHLVIRI